MQARKGGYKHEGKYAKPHPCILFTLQYTCSAKRCRDRALCANIDNRLINRTDWSFLHNSTDMKFVPTDLVLNQYWIQQSGDMLMPALTKPT